VAKGPAPLALRWHKITGGGNTFVVDEDATVPPGTKVKT
jgi:hypothetical protein